MKNIIGKAQYDELAEWVECIMNMKNGDNLTLIINKRLVMCIERNNNWLLKVYSRYKINDQTKEIYINRHNVIVEYEYGNTDDDRLFLCNYISYLFQEFVRSKITVSEVTSGLVSVLGMLGLMTILAMITICL